MSEKKIVVKSEETEVPIFMSNEELKKKAAEIEAAKRAEEEQS